MHDCLCVCVCELVCVHKVSKNVPLGHFQRLTYNQQSTKALSVAAAAVCDIQPKQLCRSFGVHESESNIRKKCQTIIDSNNNRHSMTLSQQKFVEFYFGQTKWHVFKSNLNKLKKKECTHKWTTIVGLREREKNRKRERRPKSCCPNIKLSLNFYILLFEWFD